MDKAFFLLLLVGLTFAVPACPYYPYKDYITATSYQPPVKPSDTLLQYCDWNLGEICILSNVLNTTEDKKLFIAEFIANDSFSQIWQWNNNINFGKYPPNSSKSSTNIKDAWVSIAYLNPSVYDNGTYLLNSTSQPLIKHDFTFVVDTRKLSGDCKDTFRICGYDYPITIANTSSNLTANMNVKSEYMVDRYHLVTHCGMFGCWVTCDYYRTDDHKDSLSVSDSKKIKYLNFIPTSNYSLVSRTTDLLTILINVNDSVFFQIGNSTFYKANYTYRIRNESGSYNILVKEVVYGDKISSYGLSVLDKNDSVFKILVPYSHNCTLTSSDHFNSKTISGCAINLTNMSQKPDITPIQPKFFDSLFLIVSYLIVAYVIYLAAKRLMSNA